MNQPRFRTLVIALVIAIVLAGLSRLTHDHMVSIATAFTAFLLLFFAGATFVTDLVKNRASAKR